MKAVQQAFEYQRKIAKDWRGATVRPFVSKLQPLVEVIKISNLKGRKKFLANLCGKAGFDSTKLDVREDPPLQAQFGTFIAENLAFSITLPLMKSCTLLPV